MHGRPRVAARRRIGGVRAKCRVFLAGWQAALLGAHAGCVLAAVAALSHSPRVCLAGHDATEASTHSRRTHARAYSYIKSFEIIVWSRPVLKFADPSTYVHALALYSIRKSHKTRHHAVLLVWYYAGILNITCEQISSHMRSAIFVARNKYTHRPPDEKRAKFRTTFNVFAK